MSDTDAKESEGGGGGAASSSRPMTWVKEEHDGVGPTDVFVDVLVHDIKVRRESKSR